MQIVLIEWDGKKPPTTWYKRLRKLGLKVRGDKSTPPIQRRSTEILDAEVAAEMHLAGLTDYREFISDINSLPREQISAVIIQEGAVICASPSLARLIAGLAKQQGAITIQVGDIDIGDYVMSDEDHKFLEYVNGVYGRIGAPPADEHDEEFVVTCYEEADSFEITAKNVVNCPSCHGVRVAGRRGSRHAFRNMKTGDDVMWYWLATRFASGYFEIPKVGREQPDSYSQIYDGIAEEKERKVVDLIANGVGNLLFNTSFGNQLRVMDAVFASRAYIAHDVIMHARVDELSVLFSQYQNIDVTLVPLAMPQDSVDMLDAAPIIKGNVLAGYYMANLKHKNEHKTARFTM